MNDPFCLPLQPGTPCADLRAFASVAIDRPNHCSAPTPAKPPERHHSEKALLRWLREAKNQNDRGRLVHVFKQVIRAGWLEKLSSEDILRCAESMRFVRYPQFLEGVNTDSLAQQTSRVLEQALQTLRQRTYHSDDILLRIQCLECHCLALTGDVKQIGSAARKLLITAAPTGMLEDLKTAESVFRALTQSICAYKRQDHPDSAKGALFCVLYSWTTMRPYLFSQQEKAHSHNLYILGSVIRRCLFDVLVNNIERPGDWYQSRQVKHNPETYQHLGELLIECYTTRGLPLHALSVLRSMQQVGVPVKHYNMTSVLKVLISHDLFELADDVYADFRDLMKNDLTSEIFLHASLQYFAHKGDCESVEDIREELIRREFPLNGPRKAWIMHAYAVTGNPDQVVEHFESFFPSAAHSDSNSRIVRPSIIHYGIIIYAYSVVGDVNSMNSWLEKILATGLALDVRIFNDVLKAFSRREDLDAVEATMKQMRASGVKPNHVTYTILMRMYGRRRDPINAENVFHQALGTGLSPNQLMVLALMDAHADSGSWKGVIRVFDYIRANYSNSFWLDVHIYNALLRAYVLVGSPFATVLRLLEKFGANGLTPNPTTYLLVIQAACNSGEMDAARSLLAEMTSLDTIRGSCRAAECFAYTMMMGAFLRLEDKDGAKEMYSAMQNRNIVPTSTTFGIIIRAYGNEGTSEGLHLAEEFLAALLRFDPDRSDPIWTNDPRGRTHALEDVFVPVLQANSRWQNTNHVEHHFSTLTDMAPGNPTILALCPLMDSYRRAGDMNGVKVVWNRIFETALWETRSRDILHDRVGTGDGPGSKLTVVRESKPDSLPSELERAGQYSQRSNILCVPLSTYISALSSAGMHAEVAQAWAKAKAHGFGFDSHNWNHLAICLVRAGEPERAFEVLERVILPFQDYTAREIAGRESKPETPFTFIEANIDGRTRAISGGQLPDDVQTAGVRQHAEDVELGRAGPAKRPYAHIQESEHYYPDALLKLFGNEPAADPEGDLAEGLHLYHQISPAWNHWKPHRITLHILDTALRRLASGRMIRPAGVTEFLEVVEHEGSMQAAEELHRRIIERFPAAVKTVYSSRSRLKRDIRQGITHKGYMNSEGH